MSRLEIRPERIQDCLKKRRAPAHAWFAGKAQAVLNSNRVMSMRASISMPVVMALQPVALNEQ